MLEQIDLNEVVSIAISAGEKVLDVYQTDFQVEKKEDQSPLTLADRQSHMIITTKLNERYPGIPILSEEGREIDYSERSRWEYLWIVDPLDGTKEFVKKNGEFTINIALVHHGKPVLGVIYAPVLDTLYVARKGMGAYKLEKATASMEKGQWMDQAKKLPLSFDKKRFTVVASRSHLSPETEEYIDHLKALHGDISITSAGSSLKLCLVAEGKADVYPRFAPTMEWDTAAGQAIVEQAGGKVLTVEHERPLTYNKENLLNPWFLVKK